MLQPHLSSYRIKVILLKNKLKRDLTVVIPIRHGTMNVANTFKQNIMCFLSLKDNSLIQFTSL